MKSCNYFVIDLFKTHEATMTVSISSHLVYGITLNEIENSFNRKQLPDKQHVVQFH